MFDLWLDDIEITTLTLRLSIFVLLPIQFWLCFKVKNRTIRRLPGIILSVLTAALLVLATTASGWDGLGYIMLAILTSCMLLMCVIAWIVWAIVRFFKRKR